MTTSVRGSRIKRLPRTLRGLFILGAALSVLLAAEGAFRVFYWVTDTQRGFSPNAYMYVPYVGYLRISFQNNGHGLMVDRHGLNLNDRTESRDLRFKAGDEFRVAIFGGSSVEGRVLASERDTLASRLEEKFRALFVQEGIPLTPRVVNAGLPGYFSPQELLLFNFYLMPHGLDYAIFFNGANDFGSFHESADTTLDLLAKNYNFYQGQFFESYNRQFSIRANIDNMLRALAGHSAFMDWFYRATRGSRQAESDVPTWRPGKSRAEPGRREIGPALDLRQALDLHVSRYLRNIRSTLGIARGQKVPIAYILQPQMLGEERLSTEELPHYRRVAESYTWHGERYFVAKQRFYEMARAAFADLQGEYSGEAFATVGDLSHVFDDKTAAFSVYSDHNHYTSQGRQIIAEQLFGMLRPHVLRAANSRLRRTAKGNSHYRSASDFASDSFSARAEAQGFPD